MARKRRENRQIMCISGKGKQETTSRAEAANNGQSWPIMAGKPRPANSPLSGRSPSRRIARLRETRILKLRKTAFALEGSHGDPSKLRLLFFRLFITGSGRPTDKLAIYSRTSVNKFLQKFLRDISSTFFEFLSFFSPLSLLPRLLPPPPNVHIPYFIISASFSALPPPPPSSPYFRLSPSRFFAASEKSLSLSNTISFIMPRNASGGSCSHRDSEKTRVLRREKSARAAIATVVYVIVSAFLFFIPLPEGREDLLRTRPLEEERREGIHCTSITSTIVAEMRPSP